MFFPFAYMLLWQIILSVVKQITSLSEYTRGQCLLQQVVIPNRIFVSDPVIDSSCPAPQIRVHLQHLGHPIANEDLYIKGPPPFRQPDGSTQVTVEQFAGANGAEEMDSDPTAEDGKLRPACVGVGNERESSGVPAVQPPQQEQQRWSASVLEGGAVGGADLDPMCTQCPQIPAG